jgi:hypothetical protein
MTENARHPVDVALRAVTTTLESRSDDFEFARDRLMEAIAAASEPRTRTMARVPWAVATALIVAFTVFVVQTTSTSPAGAVISDLVQVVETSDHLVIPDDLFALTVTEGESIAIVGPDTLGGVEIEHDFLFYILPATIERWTGDQGTVRSQKTVRPPRFFSAADEAAYSAAGLNERDRVGEAVIHTQPENNRALDEEWPTNPGELESTIRSRVGNDEFDVLNECLVLLREPLLPLELRAAVLEVVAGLDLELVEKGDDGGGTFSFDYELEDGPRALTFRLDGAGYLVFEDTVLVEGYPDQGVPPGTSEHRVTYTLPVIVDSLP